MKLFAIVGPDGMYITAAHKYPGWAWVELRNELDKVHADDISTDEIMHLIALGFVCIELHTYDPSKQMVVDKQVFDFLHGSGDLEGCSFGERHPVHKGAFWWRKFLKAGEMK